ncbi:MAG: sodium:solute symporter family protein [Roseivirga sp.]
MALSCSLLGTSLATTDFLIVALSLVFTLGVGLHAGRGIRSLTAYALGQKQYSTTALVLTCLATQIGGGTIFGDSKEIFQNGVIMTAALSGFLLAWIIRTWLIAPEMHRFEGCLTMGQMMGKLYGRPAQIITGVLNLGYAMTVTGLQLITLGIIGEEFLGLQATAAICIGGLLLAAYTAWGGIKAVAATDVLQFLVLMLAIPIMASIVLEQAGGLETLIQRVPAEKWRIVSHERFSYYFSFFLMWGVFSAQTLDPAIMQRFLMARDAKQLRAMFLLVGLVDVLVRLVVMVMALSALVLFPMLKGPEVVPHLVHTLLPVGLKGLVVASFLSMVLSTADSFLHAASLTLTHDLLAPLSAWQGKVLDEVYWARRLTMVVGLGGICVALQGGSLIQLSLRAISLTGPVLCFPLLLGIMRLRPDEYAFYGSVLGALLSFAGGGLYFSQASQHLTPLWSTLMSGFVFVVVYLVRHGKLHFEREEKERGIAWISLHKWLRRRR